MRDLWQKGYEALEQLEDRREEKYNRLLNRHVDAMSDRVTVKRYLYVLGTLNLLLWVAVLVRPFDVLSGFQAVASVDDRLVMTVLIAIFGVGMWLTYAVFRLKYPHLESREISNEFMSTYAYNINWTRKFRVWVTSVSGGVVNLLALAIAEGLLVSP